MVTEELASYDGKAIKIQIYKYQRKVEFLLYATMITRPDVACMVNKLTKSLLNLSPQCQKAVVQAVAYMYLTWYYAIEFGPCMKLLQMFTCTSDAVFVDDIATCCSTEGYLFQLFSRAVDWHLTKQKIITIFSMEVELLALMNATKELYSWVQLFKAITFNMRYQTMIDCDN